MSKGTMIVRHSHLAPSSTRQIYHTSSLPLQMLSRPSSASYQGHVKGTHFARRLHNCSRTLRGSQAGTLRRLALDTGTERATAPTQQTEPSSPRSAPGAGLLAGRNVVVVGGGPAGMLAAMRFAQQGAKVDVYETREFDYDPGTNTWFILLNERGLRALESAGIDATCDPSLRFAGAAVVMPDGGFEHNASLNTERSLCGNRAMHTKFAQEQALRLCGDNITLHHGCKLLSGDLAARTLRFTRLQGAVEFEEFEVAADLIVGADGARSSVRNLMAQQVTGFSFNTQPSSNAIHSFYVPRVPSAEDLNSLGKPLQLFPEVEHPDQAWYGHGNAVTFLRPRPGRPCFLVFNTYTTGKVFCSIMMANKHWEKQYTEEEARALLLDSLPQLPLFIVDIIAQVLSNSPKPLRLSGSVKCTQISAPGVLLVGDAAHAVSPALGQGANSGLEDSVFIGRAIEQAGGDIESTCQLYSDLRLKDAHALVDLDRATQFANPNTPAPLLVKIVKGAPLMANLILSSLTARLPGFLRVPRCGMVLMTEAVPYAKVWALGSKSVGVLAALVLCVVSALAFLLTKYVSPMLAA